MSVWQRPWRCSRRSGTVFPVTAKRPVVGGSYTSVPPVKWSPERDRRNPAPGRGPRCTVRGCVFPPEPGGACREHREQEEAGPDPRALAMQNAPPVRDWRWPRINDLTPAQKSELTDDRPETACEPLEP